jgi:ankyrin repeat protein
MTVPSDDWYSKPLNDWYQREQLHFAASDGDLEKVKALLKEGYSINAFDDLSWTPLHCAAKENRIDVVKFLIDAGADVNAHHEKEIGDTALKLVVEENCTLEMVKILIDSGADPTIPGWMTLTALDRVHDRIKLNESRKRKKQKSDAERKEVKEIYKLLLKTAKKLNPSWPRLNSFAALAE